MKAVVIYEAGGPEKLIYTDVPKPEMKVGWSLIKIQAFGINHSEIFTRKGQSPSVKFPRILGIECVGVIEESEIFPKGQQIIMNEGRILQYATPDEIIKDPADDFVANLLKTADLKGGA